jgi:outer membrane protein assembly factor BamE
MVNSIRIFLALSAAALAACTQTTVLPSITPHKIDIQQGNYVTQDMVAKLKPGMTRNQVRFILGTPLVVDPFRTDRWDYFYAMRKGGAAVEQRRMVVIFKDDRLARIEGDVAPAGAARTEGGIAVDKPKPADPGGATPAAAPGDASAGAPADTPAKPATAQPAPAAEERGFFGRMLDSIGF